MILKRRCPTPDAELSFPERSLGSSTKSKLAAMVAVGLAATLTASACGSTSSGASSGAKSSASGTTGSSKSSALTPVSVTLPAPSASFWDIYAAAQEGFFSKYGINVTIGSTPGPAATLAAVTSGGDDIGSPFISDTIVAIAKGSPIEVIGGEGNSTVESLVGSKGLKNVSGLSGKKIVVTTPKDLPTYAIEQYLAKHGLAAGSYSLVYTESSPSRLAALKSGAVAGAQLLSPWDYEALSQGFSNLGLITSPYLQVAPVANKGWVKSHKAAAMAYLKGTMAAVQWLYNPKNKAAALQILEKATKISAGAAASGYSELIGGRVFPTNGSIPTSSFNQTISAMQTLGLLSKGKSYSLNQFFDQAPLAAANGS